MLHFLVKLRAAAFVINCSHLICSWETYKKTPFSSQVYWRLIHGNVFLDPAGTVTTPHRIKHICSSTFVSPEVKIVFSQSTKVLVLYQIILRIRVKEKLKMFNHTASIMLLGNKAYLKGAVLQVRSHWLCLKNIWLFLIDLAFE